MLEGSNIPRLFTIILIDPSSCLAAAAKCNSCSLLLPSATFATTFICGLICSSSCLKSARSFSFLEQMATLIPSFANAIAIERPMPLVAPVMREFFIFYNCDLQYKSNFDFNRVNKLLGKQGKFSVNHGKTTVKWKAL